MGTTGADGGDTRPLSHRIVILPNAIDPQRADRLVADLRERAEADPSEGSAAVLDLIASDARLSAFLGAVMANSAYLRDLCLIRPERLGRILTARPEAFIAATIAAGRAAREDSEAELMRRLRHLKQELALCLGLADIAGAVDLDVVTRGLAEFADAALTAAIRFCLRDLAQRGRFEITDPDQPEVGSGLIVLAMGKHGAFELNYSSDIDLIVFYDPAITPLRGGAEAPVEFVRLTKRFVKIMQERTGDGYVFRTDLRLRPDPGATPVAMSVPAALAYYEALGQNWERAALIKARPCAGDLAAGDAFLHEIVPFIWRKYLDFAAIADVHSIKRQIHMHKGHGKIAVAGHNVKLGRGGIREVEFFVQTQQLIAGGRNPDLRGRRTLDMLQRLVAAGWIEEEARSDLEAAYRFLRSVEHRIQMLNDEQTHLLPQDEEGLTRVAYLCGFEDRPAFEARLLFHLQRVQRHYAELFEDEPELASDMGNLVFTGDDDDPDTLQTLWSLGYRQPSEAAKIIKAWHFGRYPAMRSTKARERLTELHPVLISALAETDNADAALRAFDAFLARLPAGVQLFSLLRSNPHLLHMLATVMGSAPRLAETVARRVHVLDAVLDPAFYGSMPSLVEFRTGLDLTLAQARHYEEALDRARIFTQEQQFLVGLRLLSDTLSGDQVGYALARLAEVVVDRILTQVEAHVGASHGKVAGGQHAVIAMGKLGGEEMTATSDLDLILLYDVPGDATQSDGARPLPVSQYYIRLTQRLVTALSAQTAEGTLYEVDFRLRPSGNAGPLATSLLAFETYQKTEAWTWEHMALTRGRVIAASSPDFAERVTRFLHETLRQPRDRAKVALDVAAMRARIEKEKGTRDIWDLKQVAGGLVDIEFIAQFLQLVEGDRHPQILAQNTGEVLARALDAGLLDADTAGPLSAALRLYHRLTQVLRMTLAGSFKVAEAPRGVVDLLLHASSAPDLGRLELELAETQQRVRQIFETLVGPVVLPEALEA
ncbi:bifunctional [glutamine synthetase] adenylyltransferase/[glutamine synthetase]-adenylyl-L-tyrosine phosphorylase [Pannonibacter tanglangensis]|uniref:Bifunctional glutamine synthetase adenylyltransferase/adenylyl-removing enzyme n=1 Tax=Pannonibacter tanglangensis TaxID=2750084 RepID=A0ABW9ZEG1_9HYPH|nr:bifunctional [glutamine synthetase] adenylyltransferase/[glutamine synthetase]-adenylyl-L-tyrosine phosphorylase [Pannonibacter sp. XCT-34]NBN62866.1 bifunctional [glutamine synthetase] adenylyltransferase/[glutamine synthetase]-adenylyl-L-tyrosine phosphorylase [Pannonibacter sp. XCT-34]